ncbi:unnamed protein product [Adineta steineri]|uniref:Uncharacterized protein n=1 Tax=Adineta steineri TaxID=433720 RepID=A0A815HQS0_9BILA|nr:unnamed protein product [Adineta steineri]CAF3941311.1 unnamed protein product [Adineta steineri]
MDNFDYSMEIKQEPLSLPPISSLIPSMLNTNDSKIAASIKNPFVPMTIVPNIQYHNQSNIKAESEDLFEMARQKKFNLNIPSEHEEPNKKFRLSRKAFAIVCRSNMTRMQCNYRVTNDDRAWNSFLKKTGQYIEFGEFQSVTSHTGTRSSKTIRAEHKQTRTTSSTQNQHFKIPKRSASAKQISHEIMINIKIFIENAMEFANAQISAKSQHEKNA